MENLSRVSQFLVLKRIADMLRKIVIAIDGYSACGKSTTAKDVAKILGYRYIDSGAMYRAVTLYFLDHHISLTNPNEVSNALKKIKISFIVSPKKVTETYLNGLCVEDEIRHMRVSDNVSQVSAIKAVRQDLVAQQRRLGKDKGVVMDGRDIGTVVFPQAELKLFMTADIMVRAFRRQKELLEQERLIDLDDVIDNLNKRDTIDTTRKESPLRQAQDAWVIDTTHITLDEQVDQVIRMALSKMVKPS
jgi:cytidylate kinase